MAGFFQVAVGALVPFFADAEFGGEFLAFGGVVDGFDGFEGEDVHFTVDILGGDLKAVEEESGSAGFEF
jgi:hypothetical protein